VSRARVAAWAAAVFAAACGSSPELHLVAAGGRVLVRDGAQVIAEYRADGPRGPAVWPLLASSGEPVTRAFPFATLDGEARDHPHHTSLWLAHGAVDGVDFWQGDGRVVAVGPTAVEPATATLRQAVEWRRKDGGVVCHEQRALRFHTGSAWRAVDVQTKLWRDDGELRFGDTKEGTFAIRLRPEFCLEGPGAAGSVSNSEGDRGGAAWGKRARWVAYQATLAGALHTVRPPAQPRPPHLLACARLRPVRRESVRPARLPEGSGRQRRPRAGAAQRTAAAVPGVGARGRLRSTGDRRRVGSVRSGDVTNPRLLRPMAAAAGSWWLTVSASAGISRCGLPQGGQGRVATASFAAGGGSAWRRCAGRSGGGR
jgi:hypothetical protein